MSFLSVYGYSPSFLKFSRVVTLASTATSDNLVGENCRGRRKNISIFRDFKFVEDKSSNIFFFSPSFQRFDRSIFENRSSSNEFSRQWEIFPTLEALERKHIRRGGGVSIELRHIDSAGEVGARYRIFLMKSNRWPLSGLLTFRNIIEDINEIENRATINRHDNLISYFHPPFKNFNFPMVTLKL